jgi:hypothetical protein
MHGDKHNGGLAQPWLTTFYPIPQLHMASTADLRLIPPRIQLCSHPLPARDERPLLRCQPGALACRCRLRLSKHILPPG